MRWSRVRNGLYKAGPYTVISHDTHRPCWTATGPGVPETSLHGTKAAAQLVCGESAARRAGPEVVVPVLFDVVVAEDGRRGYVATVLTGDNGTLYCIRFPGNKRLYLFRGEFRVVVP